MLIWLIRVGVCDWNRIGFINFSLFLLIRGELFFFVICDNRSRFILGSNMFNKGFRFSRFRFFFVSFEKFFFRGGKKWISLCYFFNILLGVLLIVLLMVYWCIYLYCLVCFFNYKFGFLYVCVMFLCLLFFFKIF